jgi:hypothetical protein
MLIFVALYHLFAIIKALQHDFAAVCGCYNFPDLSYRSCKVMNALAIACRPADENADLSCATPPAGLRLGDLLD